MEIFPLLTIALIVVTIAVAAFFLYKFYFLKNALTPSIQHFTEQSDDELLEEFSSTGYTSVMDVPDPDYVQLNRN